MSQKPIKNTPANTSVPKKTSRLVLLFPCIFLLAGLIAAGIGGWNLFWSLRCGYWPTTEGTVWAAEIQSHRSSSSRRHYYSNHHTYSASITYHYKVAKVNYTGTEVAFGEMSASHAYAQRILDRYPAQSKVTVHYAPDNPEMAVLEPGIHGGTWVLIFVGTLFLLLGWGMWNIFRFVLAPTHSEAQNQRAGNLVGYFLGFILILMGSPNLYMALINENYDESSRAVGGCFGGLLVLLGLRFIWKVHSKSKHL